MSVTLASVGSHLYIMAQTFATEWRVETVVLVSTRCGSVGGGTSEARRDRAEGREETDGDDSGAGSQRFLDST